MNLLTDARRNLVAHFRSVHVAVGAAAETSRLLPSATALARWLSEYQQAFFAAHAEAHEARQDSTHDSMLHGLHGRSLTLEGEMLLSAAEDIALLGQTALRAGLATVLAIPVTSLAAYGHAVAALRTALPQLQYRLDCTGLTSRASTHTLESCRATLAEHMRQGGNVTLVGDLGVLRATGLFADELFNAAFVALHARPFPGVRHQNRFHDFSPCRDYISWYVDSTGDIYPCAGMAGHAPARFGSILQPFMQLIDALAYSERSIDALSRRGPRLAPEAGAFPADLCALHRQAVHGIGSL